MEGDSPLGAGDEAADISAVARAQQGRNARAISLTLTVLTFVASALTWQVGAPTAMPFFLASTAVGMGASYLLARRGLTGAAVLLLSTCVFIEHVGAVAIVGALAVMPFVAPAVILVVAATMRARHLPMAFAACVMTLGAEGALSAWSEEDKATVGAAALMAALTFVVSLLHVRGVERAFALAAAQSRARERAAEQALESERRFRLVAETAEDLISLIKPNGGAVFMSQSHERVLGVPVSVLGVGSLTEHLRIENREEAQAAIELAFREGQARLELRVRRPDNGERILDVRMRRIESGSGVLLALISRDVTDQRALESRVQSSERIEALGQLAGSVAHDFNNLLTVIQGSAEIAKLRAPVGEDAVREELDAILSASATAADLSRQLLTFSRKQLLIRVPTDVGAALAEQRDILVRLVGRKVRLEYALTDDLPRVIIPKAHVEQLAMNLAANARDAMPSGGSVRISTRLRRLGDREAEDLIGGEYLELEVRDTGQGIAPEIIPRVFEPLFSTKGGLGTGLGLATCHAIVAQAGGAITVTSELGVGTSFRVFLPVKAASSRPESVRPIARDPSRVLVVDDDENVRELVTRMLRADGFSVCTAASLSEALAILEDANVELDTLVTDVVLGDERGTELLQVSRRLRPTLSILVISGYTPEPEASEALSKAGATFLAKPFGRDQLRAALRRG